MQPLLHLKQEPRGFGMLTELGKELSRRDFLQPELLSPKREQHTLQRGSFVIAQLTRSRSLQKRA
jgi:hypothetical protein